MLLADRTDEHRGFFEEGLEAEFFGSEAELVDKTRFYAANEASRAKIAAAGRARCQSGGYAYIERLRPVIGEIERLDPVATQARGAQPSAAAASRLTSVG
jgi:spore maturation protein CgeB